MTQLKLLTGLVVGIVCIIAVVLLRNGNRETSLTAAPRQSNVAAPTLVAAPTVLDRLPTPGIETSPAQTPNAHVPRTNVKTQAVSSINKPSKKKVVQDPLARDALGLVGVDPDAEEYWLGALMDPNLPKSERQDLVDDLNEQGLPDPKHPTAEDLPVLLARLGLIEELAAEEIGPDLDLKEPYDDLVNLVEVAMGGGKPVD